MTLPRIRLRVLPAILPVDGREIELQLGGDYLQYRYVGDADWLDIMPISEITGPIGPGTELRSDGTYIQYRAIGATDWINLVPLTALQGAIGPAGTVTVGTTTALSSGATPTVTNVGSPSGAILNFGIPAGALLTPLPPQGRLSLTSGVAVTTADVTGATAVYCVGGQWVPVWNGALFIMKDISAGLSMALDANSGHAGYHQSGRSFDFFVFDDAGTLRLGTGPKWQDGAVAGSDILRGTGAGSTEIEFVAGIPVNKNSITLRFGSAGSGDIVIIPARQATLVGTASMVANGQTEDSELKRLLSNAFNQAERPLFMQDATGSWAYSTATWRQMRGTAANKVIVLNCLTGMPTEVHLLQYVGSDTLTQLSVALGLDDTTTPTTKVINPNTWVQVGTRAVPQALMKKHVGLGYHEIIPLELGSGDGTQTWYGAPFGSGLNGSHWC